jgi:hypothetical protein
MFFSNAHIKHCTNQQQAPPLPCDLLWYLIATALRVQMITGRLRCLLFPQLPALAYIGWWGERHRRPLARAAHWDDDEEITNLRHVIAPNRVRIPYTPFF